LTGFFVALGRLSLTIMDSRVRDNKLHGRLYQRASVLSLVVAEVGSIAGEQCAACPAAGSLRLSCAGCLDDYLVKESNASLSGFMLKMETSKI
jgi:hypothetical protein